MLLTILDATQVQHFGGLSTPVIVKNPRGLGLIVPNKKFTVHDVADICGRDFPLEVMEVALQKQVHVGVDEAACIHTSNNMSRTDKRQYE